MQKVLATPKKQRPKLQSAFSQLKDPSFSQVNLGATYSVINLGETVYLVTLIETHNLVNPGDPYI